MSELNDLLGGSFNEEDLADDLAVLTELSAVSRGNGTKTNDCTLPPLFEIPESARMYPEFALAIHDKHMPRSYILRDNIYTIGRDSINSIQIPNRYVSRRHAYLIRVPKRDGSSGFTYCLVDGNRKGKTSRNGVFVNGQQANTYYLKTGDLINLGPEIKAYFFIVSPINSSGFSVSSDSDFSLAQGERHLPQ